MIKVDKSKNEPETLQNAPIPQNTEQVSSDIYRADDVRNQLLSDQHNKCVYCESKITKSYNDVEHYRPKSSYYWLGHTWENLLYSCPICNRTYKKNLFPLKNPTKKVTTPGLPITQETPLIINPANVDPSLHIKFRRHMMVGKTEEGKFTIELFHLNDRNERPELLNRREEVYKRFIDEKKKIKLANQIKEEELIRLCEKTIENLMSSEQEHSGMLNNQDVL